MHAFIFSDRISILIVNFDGKIIENVRYRVLQQNLKIFFTRYLFFVKTLIQRNNIDIQKINNEKADP